MSCVLKLEVIHTKFELIVGLLLSDKFLRNIKSVRIILIPKRKHSSSEISLTKGEVDSFNVVIVNTGCISDVLGLNSNLIGPS